MLLLRWRKSPFLRTPAFTFWFALETPLWQSRKTLHQWKDGLTTTHTTDDWLRKRSACQTSLSMYPSIFNSFRVIRCLNQCVIPKIAIFTTFCFPWGRPWSNHAKCCMDRKRIRCLQIVSQHVPIYLQQFPSYSNCKCKKAAFSCTAAHIFVSPGDAPAIITQYVAWMERQFNSKPLAACTYLSSIVSELYDA